MKRELKDLSLEELWQLFPITLEDHKDEWKDIASAEIEYLNGILHQWNPQINHIGSTAIPNIKAKPLVDILVEAADTSLFPIMLDAMEKYGYICMAATGSRMSFNKGYTINGYAEKVFHIHFHKQGDNDEILFRNYLINHPESAKEYERLKLSLLPDYCHDRDGYTEAKGEFVSKIMTLARKERGS